MSMIWVLGSLTSVMLLVLGVWVAKQQRRLGQNEGVLQTQAELAAWQAKYQSSQDQLQQISDQFTLAQTRMQSLQDAYQQASQQAIAAKTSYELLDGQLEQLKSQFEQLTSVKDDWQKQCQAALRDLTAYETQAEHLQNLQTKHEETLQRVEHKQQALAMAQAQIGRLETELKAERDSAEEKLKLMQEAKEALSNQFKAIAHEIFEDKSKRFTEQNRENLGVLLNPLQDNLHRFGKLVQDTYEKDSKERLSLEKELVRLKEMNESLGKDALALTQALTGSHNKTQGNWGEMVLEKVLEASGLQKDREYRIQVSDYVEQADGSSKRYQPDVIIDLPDNKQLVIDSKVSLNAYVRYTGEIEEESRQRELKSHVAAIRQHIRALSEKHYQDLKNLKTLDFVFMFIPVEPAYLLAVQTDMSLFNEAFERRIMIVGPSTLLATLRTVESIWRYEHQNQNALTIAQQGGQLYDKFVGFVETLDKLGKQIDSAKDTYAKAMGQMKEGRGNLLSRADKLRLLGVKANKRLVNDYDLIDESDDLSES